MLAAARCILIFAASATALDVRCVFSRRHVVLAPLAATGALLPPLAAHANPGKAEVEGVIARAKEGKLNTARVFSRAERDALVDPSFLTCDAVPSILKVNKQALQIEQREADRLRGILQSVDENDFFPSDAIMYEAKLKKADKTVGRLRDQVSKLNKKQATCVASK